MRGAGFRTRLKLRKDVGRGFVGSVVDLGNRW